MMENDSKHVTREEFDMFRETVNRRLLAVESNHIKLNETINDVNTNTQLILQKVDLLMSSNNENIKVINGRIDRLKMRVVNGEEELNNHVNVEPRKEYKQLTMTIVTLFITAVVSGLLASLAIFN